MILICIYLNSLEHMIQQYLHHLPDFVLSTKIYARKGVVQQVLSKFVFKMALYTHARSVLFFTVKFKWLSILYLFSVMITYLIVTLRHGKFQKMGFHYYCIWPPVYLHFATLLFSRENCMISAVLSVLSYYITCIAHTFHINGI